ncbi:phage holin family protein [Fusobacterium necrophorum]|uniref:phage holin family protein n=1 Tax=Fusobacterium necrophorum TaxID=859 RepID=UPI00254ACC93|nr:phage holin family protein [Fusobacterium necrophorum]MDK4476201.1 phage holin family protein [Fusobacterium necrophorum]
MEREKWVVRMLVSISGYLAYFLGGWSLSLETLFVFMVCDYITGYMKSMLKGKLSSKVGFRGLVKKASYLVAVTIAVSLDRLILENHLNIPVTILGVPVSFKIMIISSIVGTEGISIVENLGAIGVKFPTSIIRLFKQFQQQQPSENTNKKKKEP